MVREKILENGCMFKIIVKLLLLIYLKGKIGESYNIGSGKNLKNIDIAKKLLKIAKNKSLKLKKSKNKICKR